MEELKTRRDLLAEKIRRSADRIEKGISTNKSRTVINNQKDLLDFFAQFEQLHVQVVAKDKQSVSDEAHRVMYNSTADLVDELQEKAEDFLANEEAKNVAIEVTKKYEEMEAVGKEIMAELLSMEENLKWIKQAKDGDFKADLCVVSAAIAQSDLKFEKCKKLEEYIITNEPSAQARKDLFGMMGDLNTRIKQQQLRLKSFIKRSAHGSRQGSRANSPERSTTPAGRPPDPGINTTQRAFRINDDIHGEEENDLSDDSEAGGSGDFPGFNSDDINAAQANLQRVNFQENAALGQPRETFDFLADPVVNQSLGTVPQRPRSTTTSEPSRRPGSAETSSSGQTQQSRGSSIFKPKKMEYPKFGGNVRAFNTFRRDFKMVIEESGMFNMDQMSLMLRNECLQGAPRTLVHNIYNYGDIWEKLNDVYDDETQVVQIITKQLLSFKEIQDEDMDTFVEFVDLVEKAHYDLQAYQSSNVLSNPITVQTILEKCPSWVQKNITRELTQNPVPRDQEFNFIRKSLINLRKQARQLSKLKKKGSEQRRGGGNRGAVHAAEGGPVVNTETAAGTVNAVSSTGSRPHPPSSSSGPARGWKCYVPGCTYSQKHMYSECRAFKKMDPNGRGKFIKDKKLCVLCFGSSHNVDNCNKKTLWKPCDVGGCGKWHARSLHGASVPGLVLALPVAAADIAEPGNVLLLIQEVTVPDNKKCTVFWDHGSTTALVTYQFAQENQLEGEECSFELSGVGTNKNTFNTKLYSVPIIDKDGKTHHISAFGIDCITSTSVNRNLQEAVERFPELNLEDVELSSSKVDLLIGMTNVSIMPIRIKVNGELALFHSIFGTGKLLGGTTRGGAGVSERVMQLAHTVAHTEARGVKMDFLSAEAFGVDVPKRCSTCKSCKECNHKNSQMSFEELTELQHIEDSLVLDVNANKWSTSYSYKQDPSILQDNYCQAFACNQSTVRRLEKKGQLDAFNKAFMETVERGVFKLVPEEELASYKGPVNYISIVEAYKPGPHSTTPIRLCMNSSLKFNGVSLNDIMMKGPSSLNNILSVTLGFRSHNVAIVKDISKFYQSVLVDERDQHLRRVLFNTGEGKKPDVYKTTTVNFGDKIAGCITQTALRGTAKAYEKIDPPAAEKIVSDTYVDDTISGEKNRELAELTSSNMDKIAAKGGFIYKETVMSGDPSSDEPRKVLGLGWDSYTDTVYIGTNVNMSAKKKGVKELDDLELGELVDKFPEQITRRMVWRVVLGQYDILGLISVFTVRLKLFMKKLGEPGEKIKWDAPIDKSIRDDFLETLKQLLVLKTTRFPRCVVPEGADDGEEPSLLILADGSQSAFCALVYLRSQMKDGTFRCRLVAGKTRVAPTKKISVPRMELMGALTAVRLADTVTEGLRFKVAKRWFFTDNSAVLGMIRRPSGSFTEFVGTRVGEIRSKCNAEKEWFWVPTADNPADMGTRANVVPEDLGPGSYYQCGHPWMSAPEAAWPTTQNPGKVPDEELTSAAKVNLVKLSEQSIDFFPLDKFSSLTRAATRLAMVAKVAENFKYKTKGGDMDVTLKDKAEVYLLHRAQQDVRVALEKGELDTLRPQKLICEAFSSVQLIVTGGRLGDKMLVGFDKVSLPILLMTDELSRLYMREAHEVDHSGADRTLQRARNHVWIIQGRRLAKKIVQDCYFCKKRNKVLQQQLMAPVHENRLPPSPVFDCTAVDLFGPIKIRDSVKKRTSKECYGVMFCCTVVSAIHLELAEDYSTDAVLQCLKRFINNRGTPRKFVSDPGSQLVAAANQVRQWDCSKISEWISGRGIEWHKIPTNSQHFNGCAEAMIKVTKRQLVEMMRNRLFTKGELDTLLSDVVQIVNSRPLVTRAGSDVTSGGPITPNHLLLGRATVEVPFMIFDHKASLTKRISFLETVKKEFWNKWLSQVFPQLVPSYKWKKDHRNMMEGDVVLMRKESELSNSYRMAIVKKAFVDKDGKVRKVMLNYRNVNGDPTYIPTTFKETERSVHNLVVVVPGDYKEDAEAELSPGRSPQGNAN